MTQSYSDYEQEYHAHLAKVRSFLASSSAAPNANHAASVESCEIALRSARKCIHAMQGMAEVEGDPFKAAEAKRKLAREVGPLEAEMRGRKNRGGRQQSSGGGGKGSYAAPSAALGPDGRGGLDDLAERGERSITAAPLSESDHRMMESERLLMESQALCAGSEQIGSSTLETMGRQGEQLNASSGLIQEMLSNTEQARTIMREMAYRALRNKIFLYFAIAFLTLANGGMIVHLWRKKK